ncbi:hypothetical protein NDU88_005972 [Pleurodeles waltl]|uniref:Uncharacterized protein n=1 Tax=Pleurodeles waltl TaxID=8319 RepID=A0AAV7LMT4_PLEWA|nr:hypothetical protein NDU88_005972 [Pleurodeles waltl]
MQPQLPSFRAAPVVDRQKLNPEREGESARSERCERTETLVPGGSRLGLAQLRSRRVSRGAAETRCCSGLGVTGCIPAEAAPPLPYQRWFGSLVAVKLLLLPPCPGQFLTC